MPERVLNYARVHGQHLILFSICYFVGAELGHVFSFPGNIATLWPPSGFYLAALLLSRRERWPGLFVAALFSNLLSDVIFHDKAIVVSFGFWCANSLEAVVSAIILKHQCGVPFTLKTVRNTIWFIGTIALGGGIAGATVGAIVLKLAFGGSFLSAWMSWWVSGVLGAAILTPPILNWVIEQPWKQPSLRRRMVELLLTAAIVGGFAWYIFGFQSRPIAFLILPLIIVASTRLQVCGSVISTLILTGVCVWLSASGRGPFAQPHNVIEQLLLTQCYLFTIIAFSLILASAVMEWKAAISDLKQVHTDLQFANRELQRFATIDALTGIKNRGAFQERLREELDRAHRYSPPLSLLLIDVDEFKKFNDSYGHVEGDKVLRQVASLLQRTARTNDFVARYGGEEFAILLPHTEAQGALVAAERFRQVIENERWLVRSVTVSIGVSTIGPGDNALRLIHRADLALYASKHAGRNCVHQSVFTDETDTDSCAVSLGVTVNSDLDPVSSMS